MQENVIYKKRQLLFLMKLEDLNCQGLSGLVVKWPADQQNDRLFKTH